MLRQRSRDARQERTRVTRAYHKTPVRPRERGSVCVQSVGRSIWCHRLRRHHRRRSSKAVREEHAASRVGRMSRQICVHVRKRSEDTTQEVETYGMRRQLTTKTRCASHAVTPPALLCGATRVKKSPLPSAEAARQAEESHERARSTEVASPEFASLRRGVKSRARAGDAAERPPVNIAACLRDSNAVAIGCVL